MSENNNEGFFTLSSKVKLSEMNVGEKLSESDYSTLTPDGFFVQLKYHEPSELELPEFEVKPGIWAINSNQMGMFLLPTSFVQDKILEEFVHTKHISDKIDTFFERLHVYYEMGFEVPKRAALLYGPAGCHAAGTKILMFDGSIKNVEDIKENDQLMGPDSKPREVLKLFRGYQNMIRVIPVKGESFVVNSDHRLHVKSSDLTLKEFQGEETKSLKASDIYTGTKTLKKSIMLNRTGVEFEKRNLPIPPYILGTWLGDGTSENTNITTMDHEIKLEWASYAIELGLNFNKIADKGLASTYSITRGNVSGYGKEGKNPFLTNLQQLEVINNKHIPQIYLTSDKNDRLQLLAGLIDTDGSLNNNGFDYITKSNILADNILYLARSLGFAAYKNECDKFDQNGTKGIYQRIFISGNTNLIPTKLKRKQATERQQIKDVLVTGFDLELLEEDKYYGFEINQDHLYLTADFTIHHNTGKSTGISKVIRNYTGDNKTAVVVWPTDKYEASKVKDFVKSFKYVGVERLIMIVEDIGGVEVDQVRMKSDSSLLSLLDNQEKTFTIPVFILATTNHPEIFLGNLTNRPNRFDDKIEVGYPDSKFRCALLNFFNKDVMTEKEALDLMSDDKTEKFSPAHIREIIIRSRIYDKTIPDVIREMIKEIGTFENAFEKPKVMGAGIRNSFE